MHILNCTHRTLFWFRLFLLSSRSFELMLFPLSLYLTPGGLKQAIHAVCVCHNQLQIQRRPEQSRHLSSPSASVLEPSRLPLSFTDSHSSSLTLADPFYLCSFYRPLSSWHVQFLSVPVVRPLLWKDLTVAYCCLTPCFYIAHHNQKTRVSLRLQMLEQVRAIKRVMLLKWIFLWLFV